MTLILKQLFAFFKLLNSDSEVRPLALGMALGIVFGFSPFLSLQTFLIFIIVFFLRIQLGAAFLSGFFFKFVAFLFDPISDGLGRWILEMEILRPTFVQLYNMPIVPLTRFNNSIIMGSGLLGFALVIPGYFIFRNLISKYRTNVVDRFKTTKAWKAFAATSLYKWYTTYESLYG